VGFAAIVVGFAFAVGFGPLVFDAALGVVLGEQAANANTTATQMAAYVLHPFVDVLITILHPF
jgi:hypothetical protein